MHQLPNLLTIIRILLIAPFAYFLMERAYEEAFLIFVVAGVSDAVDGFLARQFKWRSRFGAIADPIADKLLLIISYLVLSWIEILPVWLVALIFGRDMVIVIGGLLYHYRIGRFDIEPTVLGKLCTFTQISFVVLLLLEFGGFAEIPRLLTVGVMVVAGITLLSGAHYVWIWAERTRSALKAEKHL